jgi:hypothetical protein
MAGNFGKLIQIWTVDTASAAQRKVYPYGSLPFYFHIAPESYRVSGSKNQSEQQIPGYGSITQYGGPGLKTLSFDSFFMMRQWLTLSESVLDNVSDFPSYVIPPPPEYGFWDATQSIKLLETLRDGDYPVLVRVVDRQIPGHVDVSMEATVSEFEWWEEAGTPDERQFSVTFTKWRPVRIRKVPHAGGVPPTNTTRPPGRRCNQFRVKVDGTSIKAIARNCYGRTDRWKWIRDKNGGHAAMMKLVQQGKAEYLPKHHEGPYFFNKGVLLKTPAHPGGNKKGS